MPFPSTRTLPRLVLATWSPVAVWLVVVPEPPEPPAAPVLALLPPPQALRASSRGALVRANSWVFVGFHMVMPPVRVAWRNGARRCDVQPWGRCLEPG